MPYQTAKDMIDTTALTALITAFRAEVTQNSISPEKVGGILQSIVNVLSTSVAENDIKDFTSIREALKKATTMYLSLTQGTSDRNHVYLTPTLLNAITGEKYTNADSIRIQQATTERAGAMRAQQVIDLNAAKKNIGELQDDINRIDTLISEIESSIEVLSNDILAIKDSVCLTVEVKGRFLTVQGAEPLLARNMQPYLFRLTKKANRKRYTDSSGQKVKKKNITTSLKQKHKAALQIKKGKNIAVDPADPVIFRASPAVSTQNRHTPECHTTQSTETPKAKTSDSGKKHSISSK